MIMYKTTSLSIEIYKTLHTKSEYNPVHLHSSSVLDITDNDHGGLQSMLSHYQHGAR